jgi:aryl-alcohol dehydrogenase-like predicted oxidoreductase
MTITAADRRQLGRTGLSVSPVCIGTSPLASMSELYGYEVPQARAEATIRAVLASHFNFIDTSNNYGGGAAESRIGRALAAAGGPPPGLVLATKVDADPVSGDFSGERVKRSVAESLSRLGLDRVRLMYLHDPEYHLTFAEAMAPGGPVAALTELREQGVLEHLGVAGGPVRLMRDFIATGQFDAVLSHNRFTLVDRSAGPLLDEAAARGVAFVNGAPYGGGILAKGPDVQPKYAYRPASESLVAAVRAMRRACLARGVSLTAAALQFSLRDPRVTATVVGVSAPERIAEITALMAEPIPDELWPELDALAPGPESWLN